MVEQGESSTVADGSTTAGIVYVLSNPAMEGYIKIGWTRGDSVSNVIKRMQDLDTTSVPRPFDCEHASVVHEARKAEQALHEAFGDYRVRPSREFFEGLAPFRVIAILKHFEIKDVTPRDVDMDDGLGEIIMPPRKKEAFRFSAVNIPAGASLQWADDPRIECVVDNDATTYVLYQGQRRAISPLAQELKRWKRTPSGTPYWLYQGKTLREWQEQLQWGGGAEAE